MTLGHHRTNIQPSPAHPDYSLKGRVSRLPSHNFFKVQASVSIHTVLLAVESMLRLRIKQSEPGRTSQASDSAVEDRLGAMPSSPWSFLRFLPTAQRTFSTQNCCQISHSPWPGSLPTPFPGASLSGAASSLRPSSVPPAALVPAGSSPPSAGSYFHSLLSSPRTSTGSNSPQSVPVTGPV